MKRFIWSLIVLFACAGLSAQTFSDALRYSNVAPLGTARFAGTGGSLTAMGTDMTTLHTNPAGIGWNRYNMAQITPGFHLNGTDADLQGSSDANTLNESLVNLALPSVGVVFAGTTRSVNWSTLNFGISATRIADFNQQIRFGGRSEGSILEAFAFDVNNTPASVPLDPYGSDLAFGLNAFILDDIGDFGYYSDFFDPDAGLSRGGDIARNGFYDRSGSATEIAIGFGGNYREKVLWGLSIGIPFINFEETLEYEEVDDADFIPAFENSAYRQTLSASGTGFNAKLGLIYLATEQLRFSAAVHTPTLYSIDERFATDFDYFYTDVNGGAAGGESQSPQGEYTYNLTTPWRFMLGSGYLIGKSGFISLDADYTNYAGNSVSFDDFATQDERTNNDIDAVLSSSIGVRVGGELNLKPFQLRAGVGYRQTPYVAEFEDLDKSTLTYSGGVGYSVGKFFVDLAAQYRTNQSFQDVYDGGGFRQTVNTDNSRVSGLLTVGIRGWNAGF